MPRTAFRLEKDSLGTHRVPARAYYGIQTQRALENFPISGQRVRPSLIEAYGRLKAAAALANADLKTVPMRLARPIVRAAQEVADHRWDAEFPVDTYQAGAGVSFHMNVNEVIANRAGELLGDPLGSYRRIHPNDHVNYGQSTNDTYPSALRMAAVLELDPLLVALTATVRAFRRKGRAFERILKAGRTHLQDAAPIRLGQEFDAYGVALEQCHGELRRARDGLLELGLGGSAVGTGLNTHRQFRTRALAHLRNSTGHRWQPAPDLRAAMQSQHAIAVASAALRNLALELIRISNDLRLLASGPMTGLHEIELPSLQPGSSIMPGKINPVMPEMLAMVAFQVVGNDLAVALAVQAGQLELNVMMPAMAHGLLQSAGILAHALQVFTERCVNGIEANPERCRHYAAATLAQATALNPFIGYARAAELVKESLATGHSLLQLAQKHQLLPEATLRKLLDPGSMSSG